jgi:uncharacterized protein (TIGR02246 family)
MRNKPLNKIVSVIFLSLGLCLPAVTQENSGWQFDSMSAQPSTAESDSEAIYKVLLRMLDRWNAHDLEGHLDAYWNSPELLVIVDSEQVNGWRQLHDSYCNGYPDRSAMGFINPSRIQVKLLTPDIALALTWWSMSFPGSKQKAVGNTTMNLQKFDKAWKIVTSHSSTAEM